MVSKNKIKDFLKLPLVTSQNIGVLYRILVAVI